MLLAARLKRLPRNRIRNPRDFAPDEKKTLIAALKSAAPPENCPPETPAPESRATATQSLRVLWMTFSRSFGNVAPV